MRTYKFRENQIVLTFDQTEVATIINAIRGGYIMSGKTADDLHNKLFDALVGAGRDPAKFGYGESYPAHAGKFRA